MGHPDFNSELFLDESRRRLLEAVRAHAEVVTAATTALEHTVVAARYAGITWDDIGERLGTTRQGAWKRFHKHVTFDARIEERPWHQSRAKPPTERGKEEPK